MGTTIPITLRRFYPELIDMLQNDGYEVTLVSSPGEDLDAAKAETGAQTQAIDMSRSVTPARDLQAWVKWHVMVAHRRPTLLVAGTPKCAFLAITAAFLWRVPRRVYLCGGLRLEGAAGHLKLLLIWIEKLTMFAATEVMVNSGTLKDAVLAASLVNPNKLRQTIPGSTHGVDVIQYRPRQPDYGVASELDIDLGVPVLGFVGRLTHDKGIEILIEACKRLDKDGRRFQLLIVGSQMESDSQAYLEKLSASGICFRIANQTTDVRPYYSLLQMLLLPSLREGFPNVVLEAAAMGIPTVTTTATGCRDSVIHDKTGIICPLNNAESFSIAIGRLLDDCDLRLAMGVAARDWVSSEFNPQKIVGRWLRDPLPTSLRSRTRHSENKEVRSHAD